MDDFYIKYMYIYKGAQSKGPVNLGPINTSETCTEK